MSTITHNAVVTSWNTYQAALHAYEIHQDDVFAPHLWDRVEDAYNDYVAAEKESHQREQ